MASQKTIVIAKLEARIAELEDDALYGKMVARLHELGAPQDLIDSAATSRASERVELPALLEWVRQNARSSHSRTKIGTDAGAVGFSPNALWVIY